MAQEENTRSNHDLPTRPLPLVYLGCAVSLFLPGGGHLVLGYIKEATSWLIATGFAVALIWGIGFFFTIESTTVRILVSLPLFFVWLSALQNLWATGTGSISEEPEEKLKVAKKAKKFDSFGEIVKEYEYELVDNKIFFYPNIPEQMAINAIESYANTIKKDDIFVLVNNTLTGNAKNGTIITRDAIYHKMRMLSADSILLMDIKEVHPNKSFSKSIDILGENDKLVVVMDDCQYKESVLPFSEMILDMAAFVDNGSHNDLTEQMNNEEINKEDFKSETNPSTNKTTTQTKEETTAKKTIYLDELATGKTVDVTILVKGDIQGTNLYGGEYHATLPINLVSDQLLNHIAEKIGILAGFHMGYMLLLNGETILTCRDKKTLKDTDAKDGDTLTFIDWG